MKVFIHKQLLGLLFVILLVCFPSLIWSSATITVQVISNCSVPTTVTNGSGTVGVFTVNGITGEITIDSTKPAFAFTHTAAKKCKGTMSLVSFTPDTSANQEYASGTYSIQVLTPATDGSGKSASLGDVLGTFTLSGQTASVTPGSVILQQNSVAPQTFKLVEIKPGVLKSADVSLLGTPGSGTPFGTITVSVS